MRQFLEVAALCAMILLIGAVVVAAGTFESVRECYASHQGEPVRWGFPDGCQVKYGHTFTPV
jgi:hypothetical protein